jgi:hypothetical protein
MSCSRLVAVLLLASSPAAVAEYMVGGGVEGDSADGLSVSAMGGLGLSEQTWISAAAARNSAELGTGRKIENLYADAELDHFFDPLGIRIGAAYWGDSDILESRDARAALYWRGDKASVAANVERRNFDLTTPGTDFSPGRRISFSADGVGATLKFDLGESTDLRLSGMSYDYSLPFRPIEDDDVIELISVSRLSVINSLIDHRASITLGLDRDQRRWELDAATSEGAIARVRRKSYTLRYLVPMTRSADIEFGLGYDESEIFDAVTYFSVHMFFYGLD